MRKPAANAAALMPHHRQHPVAVRQVRKDQEGSKQKSDRYMAGFFLFIFFFFFCGENAVNSEAKKAVKRHWRWVHGGQLEAPGPVWWAGHARMHARRR